MTLADESPKGYPLQQPPMNPLQPHEIWMRQALDQARMAFEEGEVPVGAVICHQDRVIAEAHNQLAGRATTGKLLLIP